MPEYLAAFDDLLAQAVDFHGHPSPKGEGDV
jgi:hypothetical protein